MRRYRALMAVPGGAALSLSCLVARFGLGMVSFAIVLAIRAVYGSYGLGGALSAVNGVAVAVGTALLAGPVDRFGQRRVMAPCAAVSVASLASLAVLTQMRAPVGWLFVATALAGLTAGSPGALARARWVYVTGGDSRVGTALSWEATLEEITFVFGPAVATALATAVSPTAGLAAPVALIAVGSAWFYSLKRSEPPVAERRRDLSPPGDQRGRGPAALARPGVALLVVVCFVVGLAFGAINVSTIASSEAWGAKALTGVVAGVISLGSGIGGLVWGTRTWRRDARSLFTVSSLVMGLAVASLWFPAAPWQRAAWGFFVGSTFAPTMISANALVGGLVPRERLTQGLSFVAAAIGVGAAVGAPIAGHLVDLGGYRAGIAAEAAAGGLLALASLLTAPALRRAWATRPGAEF
ncbi:MAG: MFS transporter [Bifidobacteriaceae bacterium]|jgi:MFS family permease|nr:MFS transporter [Bifidobacteriaceae bacterium]